MEDLWTWIRGSNFVQNRLSGMVPIILPEL